MKNAVKTIDITRFFVYNSYCQEEYSLIITRKGERRTYARYASIQKFFEGTARKPEGTGKGNQGKGF